jgi:hypothetical protein
MPAAARPAAEFAAQRQTFLHGEKANLDAANQQVAAEMERLRSADAALHGPNWGARRLEAAALLKQAEAADTTSGQKLTV